MAENSDLAGRLALVTGATGGIGWATCEALAARGCKVVIHYHQAVGKAKELAEKLKSKYNVEVWQYPGDLRKYEDVRMLHKTIAQFAGQPDILFNNAGLTMGKSGIKDISAVSVEDFEQTWKGNCGQAYLLTQLCMPAMLEKGWGRIVFCSSVAGFTGGVVGPHYASSKSALHGLIHWLASAYAKKGITVNGVAPALITETTMLPGSNAELESSKCSRQWIEQR